LDKSFREAWRFFLANGAVVTPPGRVVCAAEYARAEQTAEALGWELQTEPDYDPEMGDHESWCKRARRRAAGYNNGRPFGWRRDRLPGDMREGVYVGSHRVEDCDHEYVTLVLADDTGRILASVGSVEYGHLDRDYARYWRAELAEQVIRELHIPTTAQLAAGAGSEVAA